MKLRSRKQTNSKLQGQRKKSQKVVHTQIKKRLKKVTNNKNKYTMLSGRIRRFRQIISYRKNYRRAKSLRCKKEVKRTVQPRSNLEINFPRQRVNKKKKSNEQGKTKKQPSQLTFEENWNKIMKDVKKIHHEFWEIIQILEVDGTEYGVFTERRLKSQLDRILGKLRSQFLMENNRKKDDNNLMYCFTDQQVSEHLFGQYEIIYDLNAFDLYVWSYFIINGTVDHLGRMIFSENKNNSVFQFWESKRQEMGLNEMCKVEEFVSRMRVRFMTVQKIQHEVQDSLRKMTNQCDIIIVID